jgi:uncharacterized protein with NAD-binding domain and iron-sulfur cluster
MARQKIAILGGGIAGLSTVYQLSKTPALRERYEITLYQLGWRLGGKIASSRDQMGRNLEHGLHVWFGCYENTFAMLQELYASGAPGGPLRQWSDAVKPQPFTPIGIHTAAGWAYWPITWPSNPGVPGRGGLTLTLWEAVTTLIGWLKEILDDLVPAPPLAAVAPAGPLPLSRQRFLSAVASGLVPASAARAKADALGSAAVHGFHDVAAAAHLWAQAIGRDHNRLDPSHPEGILDLLAWLKQSFNATFGPTPPAGTGLQVVRDLLDIAHAFIRGVWRDLLLTDRPFESLDDIEFRDWLLSHGADPKIVADSSLVRTIYDTAFQYFDGDVGRPSYAAGTAIGVIIRLLATYKGDMLWELQAGMGEAVISPLYQALLKAGVKFRFFRKVERLELSADKRLVERIRIAVQADLADGDYRPTFPVGSLDCWPSEPDWTQLVNGPAMQAAKVNFESHWCDWPAAREELLVRGTDFDIVVLAISMGAYKPLNAEPGMCDELIAENGAFARFVRNIPIVPTQALQLWCDRTTAELGWTQAKAAAVSGPEYLNIWADMTQVLTVEPWTGIQKPKSLHYLTGTFATTLYREPSTRKDVPAAAAATLKAGIVTWLETAGNAAWPLASDGTAFRWDVLTDPQSRAGQDRLDAQFIRANIDPTECCVGTPAGTTKYRLHPDETGFGNLFLAGEANRTGANTSSVEAAVMSGMAAARAISGESIAIVGYDFLQRRPSQGPG